MNTPRLQRCCEEMQSHLAADEIGLVYIAKFREYGIACRDGGSSIQLIKYCPWCGSQLPDSLRDRWFDTLATLGLEPGDPDIPQELQTDDWYKKPGS